MTEVRALEIETARRLVDGDAQAMASFVALFRDRIHSFSQLHCGEPEDAEELSQEILLQVCQQAPRMGDVVAVRGWVFRIAREVCDSYSGCRDASPPEMLSLEHLPPHWYAELRDRHSLPDDETYQHEIRHLLAKAILELPEEFQPVVYLRDWEGLDWPELSRALGISEHLAHQRLESGHSLMRKRLDEYFHRHMG